MPPTFATPRSLIMRVQLCDYCESTCDHHVVCESHLHGILACKFHLHLAQRDVSAWFRNNGLVRQRDFLMAHPNFTRNSIMVPRTDGSLTPGGNLSNEPYQFLHKSEGAWMIRVLFTEPTGEIKSKCIKLQDLDKSGVPQETIEEWFTTLDSFYKEEAEANALAIQLGAEKEEPEIPGVIPASLDGLTGRVVAPPQMRMT